MLTENKLFGDRETVANDSIVADNANIGNSIAPKTHHLDRHHRFELLEKRGLNSDWVEVNCQSVSVLSATELLGYKAPEASICRSQPEPETLILSLRNQGVSNYSIKSWNPLGERYQT